MVRKTQRTTAGLQGYLYNDDYLDDILGYSEPYMTLKPTEKAQLIQEDEDESVFMVEKILDKRKDGRKVLYLVKWDGFEEKDATWEPLSNLNNVKDMVKEFDRQLEMEVSGKEGSTNISGAEQSMEAEQIEVASQASEFTPQVNQKAYIKKKGATK